jgi:hypothetical protein
MLPIGGDRRLPLDVLHLLGGGRHLQLALVSREWRSLYAQLFPGHKTATAVMMAAVPLLAWARDMGLPDRLGFTRTTQLAAEHGYLGALQWLRANGCPWDGHAICDAAAKIGHLEMLQWARANGSEWGVLVCHCAVQHEHVELLQWAIANGCPGIERVCELAAMYGRLEVLRWARANGYPWDARVRDMAARCSYPHILRWAIDNGCPAD